MTDPGSATIRYEDLVPTLRTGDVFVFHGDSEISKVVEQVTGSINDVQQGAGETGAAASQVLGAAQELARHSSDLGLEVSNFLSGVKAA